MTRNCKKKKSKGRVSRYNFKFLNVLLRVTRRSSSGSNKNDSDGRTTASLIHNF